MKYRIFHKNKACRTGFAALLMLLSVCMFTGCKKEEPEKIDLSSTHTTAAETEEASAVETEAAETAVEETAGTSAKTAAKINTYSSGKVTIQYPSIENLGDTEKEAAVNELLKSNALSFLEANGLDEAEDTVSVECEVISADRNRITVTYTGSIQKKEDSDSTAVFYSNTIDVQEEKNLGLDKFADPYTMAGYVLSSDCVFPFASETVRQKLMSEKNKTSLNAYTTLFNQADFPFEGDFPQCFSYEQDGDIYFSIPVSHELGDYAIVVYMPDTK